MKTSVAAMSLDGPVGLLGGTFDPIHIAHLLVAEVVADELGLQQVYFVPNGQPPHRKEHIPSSAEHRLAMTRLAVADNPRFAVSTEEIDRPGPSYSADTVKAFRQRIGARELFFIVGADELLGLRSWHDPGEILEQCHVVGAARPGAELSALRATLGDEWASRITIVRTPTVDISSSEIRRKVAQGSSIRYMTVPAVIKYIRDNGLYTAAAGAVPTAKSGRADDARRHI